MGTLLKQGLSFLAVAAVPLLARADLAWAFLPALVTIFVVSDAAFGRARATPIGATGPRCARALLWLFMPLQLALVVWGATSSRIDDLAHLIVLAADIGVVTGVFGMLVAHEMIHSRYAAERALGLSMLAAIGYMHFRIAHIHFHHRLAATHTDPATARRGESVYRFMGRSIAGQWRQAWDYERRRTARDRRALANRMHHGIAISVALTAALTLAFGVSALLFALVHGAMAVLILELFNYVAHYGLVRSSLPDGTVESLGPQHSWNARQRFTNWALFNSGHHSDHHHRPTEPHHRLEAWPASPLLPAGYAAIFCLALFPPLWRRVMDRRVAIMAAACAADGVAYRDLPRLRVRELVAVLAVLPLLGCSLSPPPRGNAPELPPDPAAVARGAYLASAANCVGCHTDKEHGGAAFAGGKAIETPFGAYRSRNITPDIAFGIGAWSEQDFLRALREGIAPGGGHYFPAFPFTAFTGMTDRDMLDIRAYLRTQPPSPAPNRPHEVAFPFEMRLSMVFWRALYFEEGPLRPDARRGDEWNRGAYLVRAVAHCGECHTPRTALGGLDRERAFSGGTLFGTGAKHAPNITPDLKDGIGAWTIEDIATLLKTGFTPQGDFVSAPMSEVVEATGNLTDADRRAIAAYLKTLPPLPGKGR